MNVPNKLNDPYPVVYFAVSLIRTPIFLILELWLWCFFSFSFFDRLSLLFLGWSGKIECAHTIHRDTKQSPYIYTHTNTYICPSDMHVIDTTEANKRCSWFYELRRGTFLTGQSNRPIANRRLTIQDKMRWTDGHTNNNKNNNQADPHKTRWTRLLFHNICWFVRHVFLFVSSRDVSLHYSHERNSTIYSHFNYSFTQSQLWACPKKKINCN